MLCIPQDQVKCTWRPIEILIPQCALCESKGPRRMLQNAMAPPPTAAGIVVRAPLGLRLGHDADRLRWSGSRNASASHGRLLPCRREPLGAVDSNRPLNVSLLKVAPLEEQSFGVHFCQCVNGAMDDVQLGGVALTFAVPTKRFKRDLRHLAIKRHNHDPAPAFRQTPRRPISHNGIATQSCFPERLPPSS